MAANTIPRYPISVLTHPHWSTTIITSSNNTTNTGVCTIGTDGALICTAGAEGAVIHELLIHALGSNVATLMRIFQSTGTANTGTAANNCKETEILLPVCTAGASPITTKRIPVKIFLSPNHILYFTQHDAVASGYRVNASGGNY